MRMGSWLRSEGSRWGRVAFAAPLVVVAALALPPPDSGAGPPAATDQYREAIPNGAGSSPDGGLQRADKKIVLPTKIAATITRRGGRDSHALQKITTSPSYGAVPQFAWPHTRAPVLRPKTPSALSAAFGAIGDASFLSLVVPLAFATGAALVVSLVRRRPA